MSRTLRALLAIALLLGAGLFAREWSLLPVQLQAQQAPLAVTASFVPGKGGRALLQDGTGRVLQVRCGRVQPLCDLVRQRPAAVRIVPAPGRDGDDLWLLSAEAEGRELLSLDEVQGRHATSRAMHAVLAAVCLGFAAALWAWGPVRSGSP